MKRSLFALVWILIIIAGFFAWRGLVTPVTAPTVKIITPTPTTIIPQSSTNQYAMFVPYWSTASSTKIDNKYATVLYFGISATSTGIDTDEDGYRDISRFSSLVNGQQKKILVVRMLDSSENTKILSNATLQKKIVNQSIQIAKDNGFSGLALDLELQSLPFHTVVQQIDGLFDTFATQTKDNDLTFDATMYGDVFYRPRPFDVQYLAKDVSHIYIMSYDLHKAGGVSGPNFPLKADDYDLQKMLTDYEAAVPIQKLIVVFGMFGYDWTVDAKGTTIGTADSLSDTQIQQKFLHRCTERDCTISHDAGSAETVIHYTDAKDEKHIVWFEDTDSANAKAASLQKLGIHSFGYWAYSYF